MYSKEEILETIRMISLENLDIRTVTLGISLLDCIDPDPAQLTLKVREKVRRTASGLVPSARRLERKYGIPIVHLRISLTPLSAIMAAPLAGMGAQEALSFCVEFAGELDQISKGMEIDLLGGYSALVQSGFTRADEVLVDSLPAVLSSTSRLCSSLQVATTSSGINMDAVRMMGEIIRQTAERTRLGSGCARLVVLCNAPGNIPFMAGAFHGFGNPETAINIGISGPGVVKSALDSKGNLALQELAEEIKKRAFKITRMGELIGREMAEAIGSRLGAVDLSLAPTLKVGDSVAEILEAMGIEKVGAPGSTAALALLTNAVKMGGAMATSAVGGYSGAFIPVSEDLGMVAAASSGALSLEKLEAMTSVCSVGLDMVAIPGDTPAETISGLIADEMAIGVMNNKSTAARLIPVPGAKAGEKVEFGGLFGSAVVMPVSPFSSRQFIRRGGTFPPPIHSIRN
ncbi:MAG: PFL family protein [candidate division NC10 bacterium]|nr:PFL family protein [candidate division NC10 bacterium]